MAPSLWEIHVCNKDKENKMKKEYRIKVLKENLSLKVGNCLINSKESNEALVSSDLVKKYKKVLERFVVKGLISLEVEIKESEVEKGNNQDSDEKLITENKTIEEVVNNLNKKSDEEEQSQSSEKVTKEKSSKKKVSRKSNSNLKEKTE